jgi:hypothetical protein
MVFCSLCLYIGDGIEQQRSANPLVDEGQDAETGLSAHTAVEYRRHVLNQNREEELLLVLR